MEEKKTEDKDKGGLTIGLAPGDHVTVGSMKVTFVDRDELEDRKIRLLIEREDNESIELTLSPRCQIKFGELVTIKYFLRKKDSSRWIRLLIVAPRSIKIRRYNQTQDKGIA